MAQRNTKPEDMGPGVGHTISVAAFLLPLVALASVGATVGNMYTASGLACIWIGVFVFASLRFRRKTTFMVVERFGKFWDVKFAGPRLVIPFIDTPVFWDNFLQKQVKLFQGSGDPIKIDFRGGSAPIDASAWYQIGNPEDVQDGNLRALRDQVLRYTYLVRAEEREQRVAEIFQGAFRPLLEGKTIPEAQEQIDELARQAIDGVPATENKPAVDGAKVALEEIGIYPFPKKGIIVRDIELPPELVELRLRETRGAADAAEAVNRSRSYWDPIVQMKKGLAAAEGGGIALSDEELVRLFLAQKGFETLQQTGSNVTLVGGDVEGVLKTITVGTPKGEKS